ncbi:MAG: cytochrome c [Gemmataceae bacterium]
MNRFVLLTSALALAIVVSASGVRAEDKDAPSVKGIMKACFGKGGLCGTCITAATKEKDWEKAQKAAGDFVKCVEGLPKGEPKKGDKEAYEKTATEFVKKVKALAEAADAKDAKKFGAAAKGVTGACMGCHKAHK